MPHHAAPSDVSIGDRIKAIREERGFTQEQLAARADISVDLVKKLEQNRRESARLTTLAALADALAVALTDLVDKRPRLNGLLTPDDEQRLARAVERPHRVDSGALRCLGVVLAETRRLEDVIGAAPLLRSVTAQLGILEPMVTDARGPIRPKVLDMAGQWAQYVGWLHTAVEDFGEAERWFGRSLEWSIEAEDDDLAATVLSYKGHVAWLGGHVAPTIGLSQAARRYRNVYAGQLAYDALQEARGHAILGDAYAVDQLVDQADELVDRAVRELPDAPPWHYYRSPAFWDLERGRALCRLPGRAKQAAELLTAGLEALPAEQVGADWVTAYRRDLARCS